MSCAGERLLPLSYSDMGSWLHILPIILFVPWFNTSDAEQSDLGDHIANHTDINNSKAVVHDYGCCFRLRGAILTS